MGRPLAEMAARVPAAMAGAEPGAEAFLACAEAVVPVVGALGVALAPVRVDVGGNVERLRQRRAEDPGRFLSVFDFVRAEKAAGEHASDSGCTKGLLWLLRAMRFLEELIRRVFASREASTYDAATAAYDAVLKPYHGWVTYGVFQAALAVLPYREHVIETLGGGEEALAEEAATFLECLGPLLDRVHAFLEREGCNFPDRV